MNQIVALVANLAGCQLSALTNDRLACVAASVKRATEDVNYHATKETGIGKYDKPSVFSSNGPRAVNGIL